MPEVLLSACLKVVEGEDVSAFAEKSIAEMGS